MATDNFEYDPKKLSSMREKILELEKRNSKTKEMSNKKMIEKIRDIIIDEESKCY